MTTPVPYFFGITAAVADDNIDVAHVQEATMYGRYNNYSGDFATQEEAEAYLKEFSELLEAQAPDRGAEVFISEIMQPEVTPGYTWKPVITPEALIRDVLADFPVEA